MKTPQDITKQLGKVDDFVLIKGEFTPDDALEVIDHLITEKINFHKRKSFSNEIRFGHVDNTSSVRSQELRLCKQSIKNFIQSANNDGKKLNIYSTITIEII